MTVPSRATQVAAAIRTVRDTMPSILARYAELLERVAIEVEKLGGDTFQPRCQAWLDRVTEGDPTDTPERIARFFEEATEWVQSLGMAQADAEQVLRYVFSRPAGDPPQEAGGMLTTAAVLAQHVELDLLACGEAELARVWDPAVIEKIRGKHSRRHGRGPLPGTTEADLVPGAPLVFEGAKED